MLFAYPPPILAILGPLAAAGTTGLAILDALNALALGLLLFAVWRNSEGLGASPLQRWLAVLLASLVGGISGSLLLGQVGLWSIAPLAWMMPTRNPPLPLGWRVLCIAAAALKPTIALPFIAYWLITDTAALFIAGAVSLAVSVAIAAMTSGTAMVGEWLTSLRMYSLEGANLPDQLVSLHYVLARVLPETIVKALPALAALGGLAVGLQALRRGALPWQFVILTGLVLCFMPLHPYDLAIVAIPAGLAPLLGWKHLAWYAPALVLLMRPSAVARAAQLASSISVEPNLLASLGAVMMMLGATTVFIRHSDLLGGYPGNQS
jgi:hypothetical protein